MASIYVDQGLQDMLDAQYGIAAVDAVDAMGVSNFGTLAAGTTSIGSATFEDINAFDATPTRSAETVTCKASWTSTEIDGQNITTITLHNDGAGAATGVQAGVDGQSLTFSGVDITIEMDVTLTSA